MCGQFWEVSKYGRHSEDPAVRLCKWVSPILLLFSDTDMAEPSGNSVAASNLLRLCAFLDRAELRDKAAKLFAAFSTRLTKVPFAMPEMTSALMFYHDSPTQVRDPSAWIPLWARSQPAHGQLTASSRSPHSELRLSSQPAHGQLTASSGWAYSQLTDTSGARKVFFVSTWVHLWNCPHHASRCNTFLSSTNKYTSV